MKKIGLITLLLCVNLIVMGCKGEGAERGPDTATAQPTLQTSPAESVTPIPTIETKSMGKVEKLDTDAGFRLATDGTYNPSQLFTAAGDEGTPYVVHVLTSNESLEGGVLYGAVAAVVHPDSGEFRTYPLFSAIIDDSYAAHSVAKAYGMLDSRHLLYIAVQSAGDKGETQFYSVEKLDITSGEKTVIVPAIEDLDSLAPEEHFAPGWLTASKEKLVLNSYSEGKLWVIDIAGGEVRQLPIQTKHSWPFFLTSVSPDGELIWHMDSENGRFALLDIEGGERTAFPFPSEAIRGQGGWFYWSPNGKYAMFDDSSISEMNPVIREDSDFSLKAMNRLTFYEREGENARSIEFDRSEGQWVEVAGWLGEEDEYAVLKFYDVEGASAAVVPDSVSYLLFHLPTGESTALQRNADRLETEKLEPVSLYKNRPGLREPLLLVDVDSQSYVLLSDSGLWVKPSSNAASKRAWIEMATPQGGTLLHWQGTDERDHAKETAVMKENVREARFAGENWIVTEDMVYIRVD